MILSGHQNWKYTNGNGVDVAMYRKITSIIAAQIPRTAARDLIRSK